MEANNKAKETRDRYQQKKKAKIVQTFQKAVKQVISQLSFKSKEDKKAELREKTKKMKELIIEILLPGPTEHIYNFMGYLAESAGWLQPIYDEIVS
jgi:hypothetical protein